MRTLTSLGMVLAASLLAAPAFAEQDTNDGSSKPDSGGSQAGDAKRSGSDQDGQDSQDSQDSKDAQDAQNAQAQGRTPTHAVKLRNGIRLLQSRDLDGALAAFREAMEAEPSGPDPHYYLGVVQRRQGHFDKALRSLHTSLDRAKASSKPRAQARALLAIAETRQRQATDSVGPAKGEGSEGSSAEGTGSSEDGTGGGKNASDGLSVNVEGLEKARTAWEDALEFAKEHGELLTPQSVQTRIEAIDTVLEQEKTYTDVRKRIAEREKKKEQEQQDDSSGGDD